MRRMFKRPNQFKYFDNKYQQPIFNFFSSLDAKKEPKKTVDSRATLLRQLLNEKANEEKAAKEKNTTIAAASSSSSSSSASSSSSSKVYKRDQAALQEFAQKQREAEALEAARRQKEIELERQEKAKNREQRIPKNILMQQEILRKKEQDKLLQEKRKKEQKKKPITAKPIVQNLVETPSSQSSEPSSYSSSAKSTSSHKVSNIGSKTIVADTRTGGIALVKDKEDVRPLKEKKIANVSVVTPQDSPKISQALEVRLRAEQKRP